MLWHCILTCISIIWSINNIGNKHKTRIPVDIFWKLIINLCFLCNTYCSTHSIQKFIPDPNMAHTAYANLLSSRYYKQYIIIIYMQLYTLIFCSIISVTYQVFIIINCSSRLCNSMPVIFEYNLHYNRGILLDLVERCRRRLEVNKFLHPAAPGTSVARLFCGM